MRIVDVVRPWGNLNIGSSVEDIQKIVASCSPSVNVTVNWREDRIDAEKDGKTVALADGMELQEIWHKFRERLAKLDE